MKIVLTGGASCGKTSVIELLKERGFDVLEESATEVLREFPDWSYKDKQVEIFRRQVRREENARGKVFLDRSAVDCLVYSRLFLDEIPNEIKKEGLKGKYDKVFVLDKLPFVQNDVRIESGDEEVKKIHDAIIDEYKKLGYGIIFVPVMSIEERADFVLDRVEVEKQKIYKL